MPSIRKPDVGGQFDIENVSCSYAGDSQKVYMTCGVREPLNMDCSVDKPVVTPKKTPRGRMTIAAKLEGGKCKFLGMGGRIRVKGIAKSDIGDYLMEFATDLMNDVGVEHELRILPRVPLMRALL